MSHSTENRQRHFSWTLRQLLTVVGIATPIVFVVMWYLVVPSSEPETPLPSKSDARAACEGFVRKRLKAPSTSSFGLEYPLDEAVRALPNKKFRVIGYFDAQNSFGAMLRGEYECYVRHDVGSGYWMLDSLATS